MKNKKLLLLVLAAFLTRIVLSSMIELNNDEAYYWTYAQHLQWNYFDHPPGIALMIRLFTLNLLFQQEFFLRIGPIFCSAISTVLIYQLGKKIKDERTGFVAAILFTASPYCSIIAGLLLIPDGPQLVFWLWGLWLMLTIIDPGTNEKTAGRYFFLFGLVAGCCILCKVHGIFLWAGLLIFIVLYQRQWLLKPHLYIALLITAAIISPVLLWNIDNNFITYRYHSGRVGFFSQLQPDSFFRELAGNFLYNNPIIFCCVMAMLVAISRKKFQLSPYGQLLMATALPMIALVLFMSLFRDTLPHWTGPAYTTLIPLVAAFLTTAPAKEKRRMPAPAQWALGLTIGLAIVAIAVIQLLPPAKDPKGASGLGKNDPILDMSGFREMGKKFDSLHKSDLQTGRISKNAVMLSGFWFPAGHLDYYASRNAAVPLQVIGPLNDIHNYAWLNKVRPGLQRGCDAYFITVSNYFKPPSPALTNRFEKILPPDTLVQYRAGKPARNFFIYRLVNYRDESAVKR